MLQSIGLQRAGHEQLLNNNKEALETLSPDIIVYAVPPQAAAAVAEADLAPFYKKCRDEGKTTLEGTFLVVQWLRICHPMHRTQVRSPVGERVLSPWATVSPKAGVSKHFL